MLDSLRQDLRFAVRSFVRRPRSTLLAGGTLTLAIALAVVVATLARTVLLEPLPFAEPGRLVSLGNDWDDLGYRHASLSIPEVLDLRADDELFADVAGFRWSSLAVTVGRGGPEQVRAVETMPNLFAVLGTGAGHGRTLTMADAAAAAPRVAVVADGFARRRFGDPAAALGQVLRIGGEPHEVVGVLAPGFDLLSTDVEVLWAMRDLGDQNRGWHSGGNVARLAPGVDLAGLRAALPAIEAAMRREHPGWYADASWGWGLSARGLREHLVFAVRPPLLLLVAAVALVVLVAAANVANLHLARCLARQRELAVRGALGAGRGRLLRHLVTELAVLGAAAGLAAAGLAELARRLLLARVPLELPRLESWRIGAGGALFATALGVVVALAVALVLQAALRRVVDAQTLRGGRGVHGVPRRTRAALVVGEVALALTLVAGAGLLLESVRHLLAVDLGFAPEGAVATSLVLDPNRHADAAAAERFLAELVRRLERRAEVAEVALVDRLPLGGATDRSLRVAGSPYVGEDDVLFEQIRVASPAAFSTLGMPLLAGRAFTAADRDGAAPVAVVNRAFAAKLWGEPAAAVGRRLVLDGGDEPWREVVGVVGDVHADDLAAPPPPTFYLPFAQRPQRAMTVVVRGRGDAAAALGLVRREVAAMDPEQPVHAPVTLDDVVAAASGAARLQGLLVATFAVLATLLAAIGIYGVLVALVEEERRAIGVRLALGAVPGDVVRLVLARAALLAAGGVALGLFAAVLVGRTLEGFLYGVRPGDPRVLAAGSILLFLVAVVAAWQPARRAARVDPLVALAAE